MKQSVKNLCLEFGGKEIRTNQYQLKTTVGTLIITDREDDTFIPMMFDEDFNHTEFLKVTHDNTINPYSFKWNLHSEDKKFNLGRLESRLTFIKNNLV